jgi:MoaA/NifB/PqqE/SkfB family radical SAM enzyme
MKSINNIRDTTSIIYQNHKKIFDPGKPLIKTVLWHITHKCNLNCKYCYYTFRDSNNPILKYDDKYILQRMKLAIDDLLDLGFNRFFIEGGELFLSDVNIIYPLFEHLSKRKCIIDIQSNLTLLPPIFLSYLEKDIFNMIAFSLDSVSDQINDLLRGKTKETLSNLDKLLKIKKDKRLRTKIGLYVVVSQKNIYDLEKIMEWAIKKKIEYISFQPVDLPRTHSYYKKLKLLSKEHKNLLYQFYKNLDKYKNKIAYSGLVFRKLNTLLLEPGLVHVKNCFCENFLLNIDPEGNIARELCKNSKQIGNIFEQRIKNVYKPKINNSHCFSTNQICSCLWELGYQRNL